MPVALMLNAKAGTNRTRMLSTYVYEQFDKHGIEYILVEAGSAAEAIDRASAMAGDVEAIVAVGGDGSVHTAAQVAWKHDLPFGIIASGSGDDVARACGLPHGRSLAAIRGAVDHFVSAWLNRDITPVDGLAVRTSDGRDHLVLAVLSAGFDSRVSLTSQDFLWIRGTLRYITAMLATLRRFEPIPYDMHVDGNLSSFKAMMVCVGNGSMFGGGMKVLPAARVNDGLLDIMVVNQISRPTLLGIFPKVFNGTHITHPAVEISQARTVHIAAPGEQAWGDGELLGVAPIEISIQPGCIKLVGARV